MHENKRASAYRIAAWGGFIAAVMGLAFMPLYSAANDAKSQADRVCPGFVVLGNGDAVWSEESDALPASKGHDHAGQKMDKMGHKGHDHAGQKMDKMANNGHDHAGQKMDKMANNGHDHAGQKMDKMANNGHDHAGQKMDKMANKGHAHGEYKGQGVASQTQTIGHQHGQAIVVGKDGLCVPIGSPDDTAWMGVSQEGELSVAVESLRGALAHNSRANEGFGITVVAPGGTRLENANLQLFVRMPQHDHRMSGGHGPANDPDVRGLAAMPEGHGRYRVNTVDFSMPGPWLLEVVVTNGGDTFKAYVAPNVGEE